MSGLSIHPRHWPETGNHQKKNTSSPWKGKGKMKRHQAFLHARRLAHSATLKSLPSNQNPACFRAPGSMKGR